MIRVFKSGKIPSSLLSKKSYDGEDVKQQLLDDQHEKCYICERKRDTDFEIEHIKSQTNNEDLKYDWSNLLYACNYCNNKKLHYYDNILNPISENIEDEIKQELSFDGKGAVFTALKTSDKHSATVKMLDLVFGNSSKIKKIKEKRFFEQLLSSINDFNGKIKSYLEHPQVDLAKAIKAELDIKSEFLGFKYWIIRSNEVLSKTFAQDIIWNK